MFEQSPLVGPGTGTVTEHSAEILLLLLGAFAIGALIQWIRTRSLALRVKQLTVELARTKERLSAAERRPQPTARLRESNSTEHERTLKQLRDSREAEAKARERILELEGRIALIESEQVTRPVVAPQQMDALDAVLPFVTPSDKASKKKP